MSDYQRQIVAGLCDELLSVIHKYDDTMVLATAIGCLEVVKAQLIQDHMEDDDD